MNTSIVIPVFGPQHYLDACLEALSDTDDGTAELILVDNGTGYPMVGDTVIRNPDNRGFAVACNMGAEAATTDVLLFLNVDTVVQPGWLAALMVAFEDQSVAMAGPRIIHPDGSLQTAGIRTWHGGGSAGGEEIKQDLPTRDVDGVTGACMAIRRDVFNAMGTMDTRFWCGYEDVDLCLAVREAGYRIRYIAESLIHHHESATGPERWSHAGQNVHLMNVKWGHR